jgi:hypothetical protein
MRKILFGFALYVLHPMGVEVSASAQTYLLPDQTVRDPRMNIIRQRLQTGHGSIRPLTTYIDTDINRRWDTMGFFHSTLQSLLLEAGAEPVSSRNGAQFRLFIASYGRLDSGMIVETLTLTLTDLRARGTQVIMSSTSTLRCPDDRARSYQSLTCPVDREVLVETFLRLR